MHFSGNGIGSSFREGPVGQEGGALHDWQSLSHVRWECKYHVVIIPKYRRRVFYGRLRGRSARSCASCVVSEGSSWWKGMQCPTTSTCA